MGFFDTLLTPNARCLADIEKMKSKKNVKGLIKALSNKDKSIRSSAAKALGEIGDISAIESLVVALEDKSQNVTQSAEEALGKIGSHIDVIKPLITLLQKTDISEVRWAAGRLLARIGEPAVAPLIIILKDNNQAVRIEAAKALGKIGDLRAIDPLTQVLDDNDSSVRKEAAIALGTLNDKRAIGPLIELLADNDEWIRGAAMNALIKLLNKCDVSVNDLANIFLPRLKVLIQSLKIIEDIDTEAKEKVKKALGKIVDEGAVEPLVQALETSNNVYDRIGAVRSLELLGDKIAVDWTAPLVMDK